METEPLQTDDVVKALTARHECTLVHRDSGVQVDIYTDTGLGQVYYEGFRGDPPSDLAFRAYHYMTAIGTLCGMLWLGLLVRWCWNRQWWWMIVVGVVWFGLMTWLSVENLVDVHAHPAGAYYWDLWWGTPTP